MSRLAILVACACIAPLAACGEPPPPSPEQEAVFAQEVDVELIVPAVRNAMSFTVDRVEAPEGATVRLVMDNTETSSPAMIHNVVIVETEEDLRPIAEEAARVRDNIPDSPAILAYTPLAGPGQKTAVVFTMPPAGEYPFVCTYPGHWERMQGVLVSTPAGA
ncbi:MAG: plastocyanin/azurin family copper-binding protein [Bacteroidota bacterium]